MIKVLLFGLISINLNVRRIKTSQLAKKDTSIFVDNKITTSFQCEYALNSLELLYLKKKLQILIKFNLKGFQPTLLEIIYWINHL